MTEQATQSCVHLSYLLDSLTQTSARWCPEQVQHSVTCQKGILAGLHTAGSPPGAALSNWNLC